MKITEAAGVAQGTFYLYFSSKKEIFDELVRDLNSRVRHAMKEASSQGRTRLEAELLGFAAYFRFTSEHTALYRIIRQAEFVSPEMLRYHYDKLSEGYVEALREAVASGEVGEARPRGDRVGADGDGRAARHALGALERAATSCRRRSRASSSGSSAACSRCKRSDAVGIAGDRRLPPRALDDRGRGRRGERHPGGRDRREVRPAREAHRRGRRARQRHVGRGRHALLEEQGVDPGEIDGVMYYGSMWKDYTVWQAAPWIAHRIGARNAYAVEYDNVSCGTPVALRLARDMLRRRGRAAERPRRRRVPRVVPPRLRERALALHVQLRRRRGRGAAREGRDRTRCSGATA